MTGRQGFQNPGPLPRRPRNIRQKLAAFAGMGLWLLIWSGYNSGPWYVLHPNFPASSLELIHGVRAFFPIPGGLVSFAMAADSFERPTRVRLKGPWD